MPHALSDPPLAGQPAMPEGAPESASPKAFPKRTAKTRWAMAIKLAITLLLLGWLSSNVDWSALGQRLGAADIRWLALGFAVKSLTIPFAAARWRAVGQAAGVALSRRQSLRLLLISLFFGQILPGSAGGDMLRGWLTWRESQAAMAVLLALALDRVMALLGIGVVALVSLPHLADIAPPAVTGAAALGVLALAVGGAALCVADRVPLPRRLRHELIARLPAAMTSRSAGWALLHSVGVHLATITATILYAQALHLPIGWLDGVAVVPVAIIAAALPISLNGWGVREGAMVAGFALIGLDADAALVVSILIGLSVTLLSLPGGLLWLRLPPPAPKPAP